MSGEAKCPKCGAPLPAGVLGGNCPNCLLRLAVEAGGALPAGTAQPSQSAVSSGAEATPEMASTTPDLGSRNPANPPPSPAELAKFFPQLEILKLLGQGGMGAVYKARQPHLDRLVALKILSPEASRDPAFAERFTREARALAKLSHPNIVAIHDFGQAGQLYYFVMEFVDGASLRQLEKTRRLTPAEALSLVPKVCEALQYAHDEGVVHRDIKPSNILIDKKGRVKLADFGLAKLVGKSPQDLTLTRTNEVMGTPHYMAPEQMERPQEVDHRADIYSLGVVLYEMLTGELPLGRFAPPSTKVHVDVRLDDVVLKSLEKEPERRYQHIDEVKTQMEAIERSQPERTLAPGAAGVSALPRAASVKYQRYVGSLARMAFGVGLGLAAVMGLWTGILGPRAMLSQSRLKAVQLQWREMEHKVAPVKTNLARRVEIEGKLAALRALSTNRFLWGAALKTLQEAKVDGVELTAVEAKQDFIAVAPHKEERNIPAKGNLPAYKTIFVVKGSAIEKLVLTIEGKCYGNMADTKLEQFRKKVKESDYFKSSLTNDALATLSQSLPQPDPGEPRRAFVTFILKCDFPERVRQ